jgi:mannosyl-oligosaccharide alpha-1,2-mannosidase
MYNDTKIAYTEDESSCSTAGYLILGGQLFSRPKLVSAGQSLLRTCHHLRQTTATGLAPSDFHWSSADLDQARKADPNFHIEYDPDDGIGWTSWNWKYTEARDFFSKNGIWYFDGGNWLSKATPESYYYAYRVTKEQKYRDWAWEEFLAINKTARVPGGFAPVANVNSVKPEFFSSSIFGELPKDFLAGTLKYLYMIQAEVCDACLGVWDGT